MRGWLVVAVVAAMLPLPVLAHGYVGCVQAQLTALGQDVGAIDGNLDPDTLRASRRVGRGDLPELSARTAYDWCVGLSEQDVSLRAHWPSVSTDVLVIPPAFAGTAAETLSRKAHSDARAFFLAQYGLELVGDFAFLVGDRRGVLEAAAIDLRARRGGANKLGFATQPMPCGVQDQVRAVAFRDMALFCWGPAAYDAAWAARLGPFYTRSFVHEYAHGLQSELAGVEARQRLPSGEYALGPKWLVEGAAETLEEEYYARVKPRFSERSLGRQRKIILGVDTPLSDLHDRVTIGSDYDVSQFAAFLLGERFGRDALFAYFDALRGADSWDGAFNATFGMSLAEYEQQFQTMRTDLVAAYRFATGE